MRWSCALAYAMAELVIIARFASRPEALIAQSLLRSEGVETLMPDFNVLMAEFDPSMMEHGWRLMARAEDAEAAREILEAAQIAPATPN
jgi:hypothetical protein